MILETFSATVCYFYAFWCWLEMFTGDPFCIVEGVTDHSCRHTNRRMLRQLHIGVCICLFGWCCRGLVLSFLRVCDEEVGG